MNETDKHAPENNNHKKQKAAAAFLVSSIALYAAMRKGNYQIALIFYKNTGGGGLNLYKVQPNGKSQRRFAIDYHPIGDKKCNQSVWSFHYHRGDNLKELKKHRPHQGL